MGEKTREDIVALGLIEEAAFSESRELDLWGFGLRSLPPEIGKLTNLTFLDLSGNHLTSLPKELGRLKNLSTLNLAENWLTSLPPEIGNLKKLSLLNLDYNHLAILPSQLFELVNLTTLSIRQNRLKVLPPEVGKLNSLNSLDLSGNRLTSLPREIGNLKNLSSLSLWDNVLATIPKEIKNLTKLPSLDIHDNSLLNLPQEIGNLTNLRVLDLSENQLKSLPQDIGNLLNLTICNVSNNQIESLPKNIGNLANLTLLNLSNNRLPLLPEEIFNLRQLEELNLKDCFITRLQPEIRSLKSLEKLNLSANPELKELPEEFSELSNLRELIINDNYIQENYSNKFLRIISSLHELKNLALSGNGITTLPIQFAELTELSDLNLDNNDISELPPEFAYLKSLRSLSVSKNNFSNIPACIYDLTLLERLDMSENSISVIDSRISNLMKLKALNLSGKNKIKDLPRSIKALKKLEEINLTGNPLPIPPEILVRIKDPEAIINYYWSLKFLGLAEKPIHECKLIVIGQGSVGKTSLIQRILHGKYEQNQIKTEGISINQWSVDSEQSVLDGKNRAPSTENHQPIKLNIWDFGGQEIMHATHQFFLTKRSLYLLVLDARLTQEENRVEYWLKIIQSFGGESPVLIVGNKTDQHPLDIDRTGLQKKYPNIVGILETSAATGVGIDTLKAEIAKQVNTLPHVRDLLPETWSTVKSKLEELGRDKNFITQNEYLNLCGANDVADETSQHTLIGFLHDLGIVLHFQDERRLAELGILNPQWVTNGVYKILNDKILFANRGVLTLGLLDKILDQPEYPQNKRIFIVEMMQKFELCYEIDREKFLVPDLLPKDEPELSFAGVPAFEYQYAVLPSSIITRFIVRMNQKIDQDLVWRTGVLLKIGTNRALVKADIEDKKISIYIDGVEHTRRDAISAIRYQLDEIHDTIKGMNPQKRVPIPEAPNADPLEYDYLLQLERDGFEEHPVKDGNRLVKINVRKLLSGIESEAQRKETGGNVTNIYVGGNFDGNLTIGDGNQSIKDSYSKIAAAKIDSELMQTLKQLTDAVSTMTKDLPKEQAAEVTDDLGKLVDEAIKPKPNKRWYSVSIEGLIKAAENLDKLGEPVINLSKKVLSLLTGGVIS